MCSFCDIQNAAPINIFSDDEIERIVVGVYSGLITPQSLDLVTYQKVAEKLTNGVYNGFGKSLTDVVWNSPDYTMLNSLRNNVYVFSGAKQYHQVREMVDAIYDKDRIKPFSEYKKTGTDIFKNYNENYLRAEYNAAISQSRSASMWMDIESNKELLPMLEYVTVGDGRVRPEHAMLDRIKRPVDDKFWNNYFPPNGWNCRCTALQSDDTDKTSLKGFVKPSSVPDVFMMNAGKDKIVFSEKHTYFKVAKQDENLAANNFNMPKPRMEMPKMPEPVKVNEFVPAKDVNEVKERLLKNGVEFVNLKGLDIEHSNAVLKAVESENKFNKLNLKSIETFSREKSKSRALYTFYEQKITINTKLIGKGLDNVTKTFEEQKQFINKRIEELKKDYLGNPKYNQSDVTKNIVRLNKDIKEIDLSIQKGEQPKKWSMSSNPDSVKSLEATTIHEIGHYRDEIRIKKLIKSQSAEEKMDLSFDFDKNNTPTNYAKTNKDEYFAEWYTKFRIDGANGVPNDLLKIFKKLEDGKL